MTCGVSNLVNASKSAWAVGKGSMRGLPAASGRMDALLKKGASGGAEGSRIRW